MTCCDRICDSQQKVNVSTVLLARSEAQALAHFVRSLVGTDRFAAHAAFSEYLNDRSLTPPQFRFVEMVIDQLTAKGIVDASALYEAPFTGLHAGGPDALFAGKENVIEGIFERLQAVHSELNKEASCRESWPRSP